MSIDTSVRASIAMPASEIIIVDDNENWRDMLAAILELEGYAVTGFSDGKSFLDGAADRTPICVFLDIFMPGPSGLKVLKKLSEIGYQAPIFLISARADAPVLLEGMRNGALGVIEKPFDPYTAVLRVRQAVALWADRASDGKAAPDGQRRPPGEARLTPQEYAMLTQIAGGTGNEEAAKRLGLSLRAASKSVGAVDGRPAAGDLAGLMGLAANGGAERKQEAAARAPAKASSRTGKPGRPRVRPPGTSRSRRRPLAGTDRDC
jgi:two-component system response regulator FixJ